MFENTYKGAEKNWGGDRVVPRPTLRTLPTDRSDRTANNLAETHIGTKTNTVFPQGNTTPSPLVAPPPWSNQSPLDSHNTVDTPTVCPNDWDSLLARNPLFLGHQQVWEHPISIFDEGMANGIFLIQNYGPDLTHSQLVHSHLDPPQIQWALTKNYHSHITIRQRYQ
jgi:hypothetical protein